MGIRHDPGAPFGHGAFNVALYAAFILVHIPMTMPASKRAVFAEPARAGLADRDSSGGAEYAERPADVTLELAPPRATDWGRPQRGVSPSSVGAADIRTREERDLD